MFSTMIESATDAAGNLEWTHLERRELCQPLRRRFEGAFDIWLAKFAAIAWLELDDLTLDLNNAYGPENGFIPNFDSVSSHFPRFNSVVPSRFIILAPDTDLETEIRRAFDVVNPPRA